jgi:hypothetical protein
MLKVYDLARFAFKLDLETFLEITCCKQFPYLLLSCLIF